MNIDRTKQHMSQHGKIIVFEYFSLWSLPIAFLGRLLRRDILCIRKSPYFETVRLLAQTWKALRPKMTSHQPLSYDEEVLCHHQALEKIEEVYERKFKHGGVIRGMAERLDSDKIHLAYKKTVLEKLHHFYRVKAILGDIRRQFTLNTITFIPFEFI